MTQAERIPLPEARWYAVLTAPRMEFKAAAELRRSGYYTWLPFEEVKRTYRRPNSTIRKIVTENRAYYSRYVFVGLKYHGQDLSGLHDIVCVSSVVKAPMTGYPLQIPESVMDRIWSLGDGTEFIREIDEVSAKKRRRYSQRETVTMKEGTPFENLNAMVTEDLGGDVVWVEIDMFGGKTKTAVKVDQIGEKVAA